MWVDLLLFLVTALSVAIASAGLPRVRTKTNQQPDMPVWERYQIVWESPGNAAKLMLVVLVVVAGALTYKKSITDNKDKELLQEMAIGSLSLPNAWYDKLREDVRNVLGDAASRNCLHWQVGFVCTWQPTKGEAKKTLVLTRYEAAAIVAQKLRADSGASKLREIIASKNSPDDFEDFWDKLSVLGFLTFYDKCREIPDKYTYHSEVGISLKPSGKSAFVLLVSNVDINKADTKGDRLILFEKFRKDFAQKIVEKFPNCTHGN